jgi:hypothetical protein
MLRVVLLADAMFDHGVGGPVRMTTAEPRAMVVIYR